MFKNSVVLPLHRLSFWVIALVGGLGQTSVKFFNCSISQTGWWFLGWFDFSESSSDHICVFVVLFGMYACLYSPISLVFKISSSLWASRALDSSCLPDMHLLFFTWFYTPSILSFILDFSPGNSIVLFHLGHAYLKKCLSPFFPPRQSPSLW